MGKKKPHKQTTQVFLTTARWKFPPRTLSLWLDFIEGAAGQILNLWTLHLFFFCIGYSQKKQNHKCWLALPLQRFLESNHSDCLTSAEEQEFPTLCYEFLDDYGDYETVINFYVLMIVVIVSSSMSVSRVGNTRGEQDVPLMTHMPSQCWWAGGKVGYKMCVKWIMRLKWNVDAWSLQGPRFATVSATCSNRVSWRSCVWYFVSPNINIPACETTMTQDSIQHLNFTVKLTMHCSEVGLFCCWSAA